MSALLPNLLHFTRLLRDLGLHVPGMRSLDVVRAIDEVEVGRKQDFYHTLRCILVQHPQEIPLFDEAFRVFWRRPSEGRTSRDLRAMGEHRRTGAPQIEAPSSTPGDDTSEPSSLRMEQTAALSYSSRETVRQKDFAQLTDEELGQARAMLSELQWDLGLRRTRRWRAGHGQRIDLRRVVRRNLRYGGELLDLPRRTRKDRPRPLVLICDVSGSMERYARMLLHFLYCMTGSLDRVEVFVFATALTRVTRELTARAGHEAGRMVVPKVSRHVPDFAGGTRIGDVLREFNTAWARRVLGHGAVVLVISDGWDRGDPNRLGAEMARLHRTSHRLIWLNPLLGSPDYLPLTRGIRAALPHIDDFLPVHNLDSLVQLAHHLNTLSERRLPRDTRFRTTDRRPA